MAPKRLTSQSVPFLGAAWEGVIVGGRHGGPDATCPVSGAGTPSTVVSRLAL